MFVNDTPPSIMLAESHSETKFQFDFFPAAQVAAATDGSCKRYVFASGYFHVAKIEFDGLRLPRKERLPRRHVGIQAARQERWWHIEHQYVGVMVSTDSGQILVTHGP